MATQITLSSYKVFCITENVDVFTYGYQETPPTVCPHDLTHTIDTNSIEVVNTYQIPGMFIEVDKSQTGGSMLTYGITGTFPACPPGTVQTFGINSLPFVIRIMTLTINPGSENLLDTFDFFSAPNTVIGTSTAELTAGQNIVEVSASVYTNIKVGYMLRITGGGNQEEFRFVIAKDTLAGPIYQLTLETNAVNTYPAGSLIDMSILRVYNLKIKSSNPIVFSGKAPGTSLIPPSLTALMKYTNNDGVPKEINMVFDIFY